MLAVYHPQQNYRKNTLYEKRKFVNVEKNHGCLKKQNSTLHNTEFTHGHILLFILYLKEF